MEFKIPYSIRMLSLYKGGCSTEERFLLEGKEDRWVLRLKCTHLYFYQIQATMSSTGHQWYDFVLHTSVNLHIERVSFNKEFWKVTVLCLGAFFISAILPEIAVPQFRKGGIWEPSKWLKDMDSWKQKTEGL